MVYFNKINGDKPVIADKKVVNAETPQRNRKKVQVVPVGQNNDRQDDIDSLPQGYYVEQSQDTPSPEPTEAPADEVQKTPTPEVTEASADEASATTPNSAQVSDTTDNDDDDSDEPDTNIYPDARITVDGIALTQADQIDDVIEGAEIKGLNSAIKESGNKLDNALTMIKSDPLSILNNEFQKGVHGDGIARFEITNYKGDMTDIVKFKRTTNTKRIDFSGTYESPKGNTKVMLYASGTTTERHVKADFYSDSADKTNDLSPDNITESREKLNKYSLYAGGKFKIQNDKLSTVILHAKGGELNNSKTTQIDARYYINKYNLNIDANTTLYNIGTEHSAKTNISCYFNAEDKPVEEQDKTPDNSENNEDVNEDKSENSSVQNQNQNDKKWVKKGGLIIDFGNIDGEAEQGIGYYKNYRRYGDSSSLKIVPFIKGSITPRKQEETDSYHVTTGVNLTYNKKFSPDSSLSAVADIKDKVSFCGEDKGNIFTAFGDVKYSYKKFLASLEAKYIRVTGAKYAGLGLRTSYKANKNLILFGDASYVSEANKDYDIKGSTLMLGANVTF